MFQRNSGRKLGFAHLVVAGAIAAVTTGFASVGQSQERIEGEYLVKYKTNAFASMLSLKSTPALKIMDHNEFGQIVKVKVTPAQEVSTLTAILRNPNVEYVVPNIKVHAFLKGGVNLGTLVKLQDQYANTKTRVEEAWAKAGNKGSKQIKVALIDTGADYKHESLVGNMISGYDFVQNDSDPMDVTGAQNPGHGTHCSGSIGSNGLVDGGVHGANGEVSIMPLRFLDEKGSGDLNNGIKAIDYAIQQGAHVISASWGAQVARSQAQPLIDAVKRASDAGVIMVMAAGNGDQAGRGMNNDDSKKEFFPTNAQFDNTISVAASGPNDEKPAWSNFGRGMVHVASPGLDIISTLPGNKYGKLSGTSMATPLVSGIVAFLKAQDPSLTGAQIRALIQLTGAKAQIEVACNCRIDMMAATEVVLAKKMFVTPAAATLQVGETKQFAGTYSKGTMSYAVADAKVGTIDATGKFTAAALGETAVTVTDASGATSTSLGIRVVNASTPTDPGDPGTPGDCPLGDPSICQIICGITPDLPFCQ